MGDGTVRNFQSVLCKQCRDSYAWFKFIQFESIKQLATHVTARICPGARVLARRQRCCVNEHVKRVYSLTVVQVSRRVAPGAKTSQSARKSL